MISFSKANSSFFGLVTTEELQTARWRVLARALGWDIVICCDGLPAVRVPSMTGISFEIEPDPRHWLHVVELEAEPG